MEDKLNELSILNAAIVGLIMAALYYFLFFQANDPKNILFNLDQVEVTAKGQLAKLSRQIKEGKKLKADIEAIELKAEKIYKYIPKEFSVDEASSTISEEARLAGLSIRSISKTATWSNLETVSAANVDVRVQGAFDQIMIFLSELTRKDRIYNVKTLKISNTRDLANKEGLILETKIEFFKRYEKDKKQGRR